MHIGFRTSGSNSAKTSASTGRGEYEVVGNQSGYTARSLVKWKFSMRWPDGIVRDTGLWIDPKEFERSGKTRLRSLKIPKIQIGRIIAPMLMLPDPVRTFKTTPTTEPIIRAEGYSITEIGFGVESEFSEASELVTFAPSFLVVANQGHRDDIGVSARWNRIEAVYAQAPLLRDGLAASVRSHQQFISSGKVVTQRLTTTVANIIRDMATTNSGYEAGLDPLPALERLLRIIPPPGPTLPAPDELGEETPPEVIARSAHQYRLAKSRGASARKFSEEVRAAYRNRCAFCGAQLGGIQGIRSGIDAAHILAWSKHDLDVVPNGLALCKLHHWAFDAGLLAIRKEGDNYYLRFTTLADSIDDVTAAQISVEGKRIPDEWLPENPNLRPRVDYLTQLYADLGVTFRSDS